MPFDPILRYRHNGKEDFGFLGGLELSGRDISIQWRGCILALYFERNARAYFLSPLVLISMWNVTGRYSVEVRCLRAHAHITLSHTGAHRISVTPVFAIPEYRTRPMSLKQVAYL